jgi:hypothetical protein
VAELQRKLSYSYFESVKPMNEILTDTEQQLRAQQQELTERIRAAEESLMRDKELYLKVTGALECVEIIGQREQAALSSDNTVDVAGI